MTLTEPQVWTLIGVFATAMAGMVGIVYAGFRSLTSGLRAELRSEIGGLRNELVARMDHLDRDVSFLMRNEFGDR